MKSTGTAVKHLSLHSLNYLCTWAAKSKLIIRVVTWVFLEAYEGYSKSHLDHKTGNKTSSSLVLFRYIYVLACS